jgi:hypothetical protein
MPASRLCRLAEKDLKMNISKKDAQKIKAQSELAALRARVAELEEAMELILEVHPTRNSKEDYVSAVREIAFAVLEK